jgi:filamentous hemagglutinin family protein
MNAICKVVWSQVHQQLVVVSELVKAGGKTHSRRSGAGPGVLLRPTTLAMAMALGLGLSGASAQTASNALPTGGNVAAGTASISQSGANMVIDQSTQRAVINWQSFNVGKEAHVQFNNGSGATLNRVTGPEASTILGRISATGQITISNGNGVFFGRGSRVDVGSLVATTHSISDDAFMAGGPLRFERNGSTARVVNEGELSASLQGYVALLATEVRNSGVIVASKGTVALAAGEAITLQLNAQDQLQGVVVDAGDWKALVDNRHVVEAEGGLVILSARALQSVQGSVVRHSGSINASSMTERGGRVLLTGDHITLQSGSSITATGPKGGGAVLVGGDWQGGANEDRRVFADPNALRQATTVTMESGALIDASATDNGDGGTVVLWSDIHRDGGSTNFAGQILARGGAAGGNGGSVETSGHTLQVGATGRVDTSAPKGATGDWLIDPIDFSISAGTGAQTTSGIGADTLVTNLATNNVTISTDASTAGNGDININASVVSSSANNLTLKAHRHINHKAGVTVSTAGGAVTYWADSDNNASGNINFLGAATINTGGGRLTMAGGADSGAGTPQGSAVQITTVDGGNLSFTTAGGDVLLKASIATVPADSWESSNDAMRFKGGLSIDAGAGSITMEGVSSITTQSKGISFTGVTTLASSKASGTAISLTGNNAANSYPIVFASGIPSLMIVKATGGGNIDISTTATGTSSISLYLENLRVLASTGNITINSNGGITIVNKLNATTIFGKMAGQVDNSSSNITLNTNSISGVASASTNANLSFDTSGQVTIQPFSTTTSTLRNGRITFAPSISGLTLGKSGNGGSYEIERPISISGTISIYSSGTVTQTAALTAPSLALYGNSGAGNFTLNNASNNIGTIAASGVGNLSYWDSNALTIGTVGATNGIAASGTVDIQTLTGDLTVAQNVSTTNTTSSAVLLNAGKSTAAGTASGGNVVLSGSPTIGGGAGSTVKVYTGQLTSTDNPNSWGTQGLGRFRYNADEATNFATGTWTNVGAGTHVIYREQPSANITTANTSMEYGDALPGMTATGMVNGDLASYSVTSPVYQGSTGRLVPGTYVTSTNLAGLGYSVSGSGSGNLAVSPRTVGLSATKSADGDDTLTGNQVTLTTGVTGEDLIYSGAFADSSAEGANGNFIRAIVLGNGTSGVATNYRLPVLNASNAPVTITGVQFASLTAVQLAALSATQQTSLLSNLTALDLASMSNTAIAAIKPATLAGFSTGKLGSLSAAQIGQFSSAQLIQLSASGLWTELTTAQMAGLTAAQLTGLSSAQLAGFTAAQLAGLSSAQVAVFSVAQLGGLTDTQRSALSGAQNNQSNPPQDRVQTERPVEAAIQAMQSSARASTLFAMASVAVNPAARVSSADIKVELVRSPELQTAGLVTVSMPSDMAASSAGFAFALPNELFGAISNAVNVDATLVGGQPLPSWLQFDSINGQFLIGNVANVSFPLEISVQLGTQVFMVVISVRSI